jgi:hypothetical protein
MDNGDSGLNSGRQPGSGGQKPDLKIVLSGIAILVILGAAVWTFLLKSPVAPVTTTVITTTTAEVFDPVTASILSVRSNVSALGSDPLTNVVTAVNCTGFQRNGDAGAVTNCLDNVTVYFQIDPSSNVLLWMCSGYADGKDAYTRGWRVLNAIGITTACGVDTVNQISENDRGKLYYICGRNVRISGNGCIV